MKKLLGRSPILWAGLALLVLPGAASAKTYKNFKMVKTQGWKAELPASWKQDLSRKYGLSQHVGRWLYVSANKQSQLRVNLKADPGGAIKKLHRESYQRRLRKRITEPTVIQEKDGNEDGRDIAFTVVRGGMLRNDFIRPYTVARMTIRFNKRKIIATITLAMTADRLAQFEEVLGRFIGSFDLTPPKKVDLTPKPAAKAAGKKG